MQNRIRCAFAALMVVAVAAPVVRSPSVDSFPLSTYPMFSLARSAETTVSTAVGFDSSGERVILSPRIIGGTAEVIQAAGTVAQAIASGGTPALCREVLAEAPPEVVAVEVVTESYDVVAYFDGNEEPIQRTVHARCDA